MALGRSWNGRWWLGRVECSASGEQTAGWNEVSEGPGPSKQAKDGQAPQGGAFHVPAGMPNGSALLAWLAKPLTSQHAADTRLPDGRYALPELGGRSEGKCLRGERLRRSGRVCPPNKGL